MQYKLEARIEPVNDELGDYLWDLVDDNGLGLESVTIIERCRGDTYLAREVDSDDADIDVLGKFEEAEGGDVYHITDDLNDELNADDWIVTIGNDRYIAYSRFDE